MNRRAFLSRLFEGAVLGCALALGVRPEPGGAEVPGIDWTPHDLDGAERRIGCWYEAGPDGLIDWTPSRTWAAP